MRLTVLKPFVDKYDHVTEYQPGTTLDIEDKGRVDDLIARGLCAEAQEDPEETDSPANPNETATRPAPSKTKTKKPKLAKQ